jgi:hypothetical protein
MKFNRDQYIRQREIRLKENERFQRIMSASRKREESELQIMAEHKLLPDFLTIRQIAILSGYIPAAFEQIIEATNLETEFREFEYQGSFFKEKGATKAAYKRYLQVINRWPVDTLLANWWSIDQSPATTRPQQKPSKILKPLERETTESLLLIYGYLAYKGILPGDKVTIQPRAAWGEIVSGKFNSDLIKEISGERKAAKITMNNGEELTETEFIKKINRRLEKLALQPA